MDTLSSHYARLLGLDDSWRVDAVDLRLDERRVEIRLAHVGSGVSCPECGQSWGLADHAEERRWRHLDTMQFTTELVARLPRCRCPDHGVKTIVPPWAGKHSRFTLFFEAFAIEVLQACRTVKAAAALLGLSWDATQTIMDRAVERGLERREANPIPHVGIDEKSFGKGHDSITILTDIDGSRVLDVAPERTQAAAEAVLQTLSVEQRQAVQAVAADMLPAYANAVEKQTPNAELVQDKFHVAKHRGEAVDQVRRAENKALKAEDDDRLKGTRRLWLFNKVNLSSAQRRRFAAIRKNGLKTARACEIKEEFRWFWRHVYPMSAEEFFSQWYAWGVQCRLRLVVKVAKMFKRHLPSLLSYFRHRITSAMSEGFNSVIQALKYAARSFRSFENYRTRILFFCGNLTSAPGYPATENPGRAITIQVVTLTIALMISGSFLTYATQTSDHTDDTRLNLVPWPRSVELGEGALVLVDSSRIGSDHQELKPLAEILGEEIEMLTGINLAAANDAGSGGIVLKIDDTMESESYSIEVSTQATVIGSNYEAVAFGTATLLQMIEKRGDDVMLPHVRIKDEPAFPYRGWMIDVARQPHSIETLKQAVQLCRHYKVRYLHLHLNDNQGWTFPSTAYPQLGTKNFHGIPRYPLDELRELVRFADQRGVTIVPELETPGHAGGVLRTMPEVFDSLDEDGNSRRINIMNIGNEKLYEVLDVIVGEIAEVFASSPYIHIGCDEVWVERVQKTPEAKEYMERHGLGGGYEMYLHHIVRMNEQVKARGKQTIVWEGFHHDGSDNVKIPKDIIVMPFENRENPASRLVRNGYRIINTAWSPLYITRWKRFNPEMVYGWNAYRFGRFPSDGLDFISWDVIEPTPLVLGAQVCNWEQTERYVIPSARKRVPAMMEQVWNPEAGKTYADFEHRWRRTDRALSKLILPVNITAEGLWKPDPKPEDDDMRSVNHGLFEDRVRVSLSSIRPLRQGERIYFTLDGTIPSIESSVYDTPLSLGKEHCTGHHVMVKARIFRGDEPVGYSSWAGYEHDWRSEMPAKLEYTVYDVPRFVTRLSDYVETIPASALTPSGSEGGVAGLRGEYFANANMQRNPAFTRIDKQIDFDWGTGGPGDALGTDHFSIRWQGKLTAPETGNYLLATANDDGARLYLDGELLVDDWRGGPVRLNKAEVRLEQGKTYDLRLEYYEHRGQAAVKLLWLNQSDKLEEYLPVVSKGTIHAVEIGPRIPQPERGHKRAYVFKGRVSVSEEDAGEQEVWLRSTGSTSQLFINGELVIDRQSTDWGRTYETIELPSGIHDVEVIFIGSDMRTTQVQLPGELLNLEETP